MISLRKDKKEDKRSVNGGRDRDTRSHVEVAVLG